MAERSTPSLDELRAAVRRACASTYVPRIVEGRATALSMPRAWVLEHVEAIASEVLDPRDHGEYRRLLELYCLIDPNLLPPAVASGLASGDHDLREAAEDFGDPTRVRETRRALLRGLPGLHADRDEMP